MLVRVKLAITATARASTTSSLPLGLLDLELVLCDRHVGLLRRRQLFKPQLLGYILSRVAVLPRRRVQLR